VKRVKIEVGVVRIKREPVDKSVGVVKEELLVVKKERSSRPASARKATFKAEPDEDDVPLVMAVAAKVKKEKVKVKKEKVKVKKEPLTLHDDTQILEALDVIPALADVPNASSSSSSLVQKKKKSKKAKSSAVVVKRKSGLEQFKETLRAERGIEQPSSFPEVKFKITGTSFRHKQALKSFSNGGEVVAANNLTTPQRVVLQPEPSNKYDPNAIQVVIGGVHVGYVPKKMTSQIDTQAAAMILGWRVMEHGPAAGHCTGKVMANL